MAKQVRIKVRKPRGSVSEHRCPGCGHHHKMTWTNTKRLSRAAPCAFIVTTEDGKWVSTEVWHEVCWNRCERCEGKGVVILAPHVIEECPACDGSGRDLQPVG